MNKTRVLLTSVLPFCVALSGCGNGETGTLVTEVGGASQGTVGGSTAKGGDTAVNSSSSSIPASGGASNASSGGSSAVASGGTSAVNSTTSTSSTHASGGAGVGGSGIGGKSSTGSGTGVGGKATGGAGVGAGGKADTGVGGKAVGGAGGVAAGGTSTKASGGTGLTGGTTASTTTSSAAGADTTGGWGKAEDPGAGCTVTGTLPEYSALTADPKLPDPFKKLDGTRITSKSEWACRREEILKQLFKYIYGDKPIPAKGSVTGTVSTSKISVKVSEGGKSASFDVTVSMNGATAPAPAIIIYDGGMGSSLPIPSGVAKITLSATETTGGTGAKSGPFYSFYGTTHPAGYMVAQAWQVSRILDLLEQNPGTIDPYHVGVTGCSRNGKGAFAAGVFDNRIALTLPCESGIGGTVGLRLKEQLDPGANSSAEWPYHAISYVRWLSEVALGPFAKGNDAANDNTDRLPVDMHEAMALIAPRGLYILDNPGISNLDPKSAYVTAMAGKAIFKALGVEDHFAYQGASGDHCVWRGAYDASLTAMIDRFLKGKDTTKTGNFATDLGSKPTTSQYYTWDATELSGSL
jgi:hypothetical protein